MKRTFISTLLLSALAVFVLTGGSALARTSITVMIPDAQLPGQEHYQKVVVPAFEKQTGIKVDLLITSWDGYVDQLITLFAGGQAPDVIQVGGEYLGSFVGDGLIQPLNRWTDKWDALDDFPKAAIVDGTVNGKLYTVPYRLDQRTLLYRTDFFDERGLDTKKPPSTWESLLTAAKKLVQTDSNGAIQRAGFNTGADPTLIGALMLQNGARFANPDGKRAVFNSKEGVDALQFLSDLAVKHGVGLTSGSPWEKADPIVTGRTAMEFGGDWTLGMMALYDPKNAKAVGVALPPKRATRSGFLNVNKWAITSASKEPTAAWKWIEFVSRPEILTEISKVNSFLPARKSVIASSPWANDPRWLVFLKAVEETVPLPGNAYSFGRVIQLLGQAVGHVLAQEKPAKEALDEAAKQATRVLAGK